MSEHEWVKYDFQTGLKSESEPRVGEEQMGSCPVSLDRTQDGPATWEQEGGIQEALKLGSMQVKRCQPLGSRKQLLQDQKSVL